MTILYFTATGNSLFVAKSLGETCLSIPDLLKKKQYTINDEVVGIVFPTYFWGVPAPVLEFIEKAQINAQYIFAVSTFGRIGGAVLSGFRQFARQQNIVINYACGVQMVDTFLDAFEMEKEKRLEGKRKIPEQIQSIKESIDERKQNYPLGRFWSGAINGLTQTLYKRSLKLIASRFSVTDNCQGCGICQKVCPRENIQLKSTPVFGSNCISCFACTHNCPSHALRYSKEKSAVRFRNTNVSLTEIIEANN